jgi:hypothetical protein
MYVEPGVQSDLTWNLVSRFRSLDGFQKGLSSFLTLSLSLSLSLSQHTSNPPEATPLSNKQPLVLAVSVLELAEVSNSTLRTCWKEC